MGLVKRASTGWLLVSSLLALALPSSTLIQIENLSNFQKRFGLDKYGTPTNAETLKIAVLDIGFSGVREHRGEYLPQSTEVIDTQNYPEDLHASCSFVRQPEKNETFEALRPEVSHGRQLAQIVWGLLGKPEAGPKFYLMNARGLYNFKRAVCLAILRDVDIILFSQNWEYGSNFDGGGIYNSIVNHAVNRKIFWVNAAGNYANIVYNGPVTVGKDGYLVFKNGKNTLRFTSLRAENNLTVHLSWNSNSNSDDVGTDKDLDLYVFNKQGLKDNVAHAWGTTHQFIYQKDDNWGGANDNLIPWERAPGVWLPGKF